MAEAIKDKDEDALPNVSKVMPEWIIKLIDLCQKDFKRIPNDERHKGFVKRLLSRSSGDKSFLAEVPVWMFSPTFSTPSVYPLKGTVEDLKRHYYNEKANPNREFPGHGMVLEVTFYEYPIEEKYIGCFERENGDAIMLAWLMAYEEAKAQKDDAAIKAFQSASERFGARFNLRASRTEHLMKAYQLKEDEEKVGDRLGHSTLSKARELFAIQASAGTRDIR